MKTWLSSALEKAKDRYYANKRHKTEVTQSQGSTGSSRSEEIVQAEAPPPAAAFPLIDAPPPDSTHQVGSSA